MKCGNKDITEDFAVKQLFSVTIYRDIVTFCEIVVLVGSQTMESEQSARLEMVGYKLGNLRSFADRQRFKGYLNALRLNVADLN
ncbi:hypothetical protein [Sapientia aquatica]|uniref:Uncharacterized protein n=1 Tax=Sapientia aquatica TaxID=1549640 RepID=A0A4R5W6H8_9BURK|nr:hypothetical protein [Sapientia aquatica]TDK67537.1 hypothetical protein E2I14_07240 [Sapientia aquatica]